MCDHQNQLLSSLLSDTEQPHRALQRSYCVQSCSFSVLSQSNGEWQRLRGLNRLKQAEKSAAPTFHRATSAGMTWVLAQHRLEMINSFPPVELCSGWFLPPIVTVFFFFKCCLCRFTFSKRAARLRGCSWLERSLPGTVTHPSHVQLFHPLVLMEAGGNATLSLTPPTQHSRQDAHFRGGTHLARRLEGEETASTRAFLLMRFVRRDLCCISVFCVASTVPQNHPVVGNQEVMHRYPAAASSYLQLLLLKGFRCRHPVRRRTWASLLLTCERWQRIPAAAAEQPVHVAKDGLTSPLFDPPPPPLCLSAALWRKLKRCAEMSNPQFAERSPTTWANHRAAKPPHVRMPRFQQTRIPLIQQTASK